MPQYEDHIKPVFISFLGLGISALINIYNIARHHDRPFQLLSTTTVRLNITLPIAAPFLLIAEAIIYMFISHFEISGFSDSPSLQDGVFLAIPLLPFLLSAFASAVNVKLTAPGNRVALLHQFRRRVNNDEEMLLESRRDGVPEVLGDTFSETQVRNMINEHYDSVFWTELICLVIDAVAIVPWIRHIIGWSSS
jgi:hypothetical protein